MNPENHAGVDPRTARPVSDDDRAADASEPTSSQGTAQQLDELREAVAAARLMIRAGITDTPVRLVSCYLKPFAADTALTIDILVEAVELCTRAPLDPAWLHYLERNRPSRPITPTELGPASPRRAVGEWSWADALASTTRATSRDQRMGFDVQRRTRQNALTNTPTAPKPRGSPSTL